MLLDEIGEMPLELQVRILRLIQEREIEKVGATIPTKVDVRIIAATHRDLASMVKEGTFREDLYYRLLVVPITLPPLRAREGDIPELVQQFFLKLRAKHNRPDAGFAGGDRFEFFAIRLAGQRQAAGERRRAAGPARPGERNFTR